MTQARHEAQLKWNVTELAYAGTWCEIVVEKLDYVFKHLPWNSVIEAELLAPS
jgi:hypothetical protein